MTGNIPLTDDERDTIRRRTRAGDTVATIAAAVHRSPRTIQRYQIRLGLRTLQDPPPPLPDGWEDHALRLLDDGASLAETARTIGVDFRTVRRRFPDRGWTHQQAGQLAQIIRRYGKEVTR